MKKFLLFFTLIIFAVFLITACSKVPTQEEKYADAIAKYENAEFQEAKEIFSSLSGYEDSDDYYLYCDLMESIQGRYLLSSGSFYFTINGFKVMDWFDGGYVEALSSKEIKFSDNEREQKYIVIYEDSKIALKGVGGLGDGYIYPKAH